MYLYWESMKENIFNLLFFVSIQAWLVQLCIMCYAFPEPWTWKHAVAFYLLGGTNLYFLCGIGICIHSCWTDTVCYIQSYRQQNICSSHSTVDEFEYLTIVTPEENIEKTSATLHTEELSDVVSAQTLGGSTAVVQSKINHPD